MNRKKILLIIILLTVFIIMLILLFKPITSYKKISISEDKWNKIISTREENKNLILRYIKFNDYNLIIDEKNNNIYYSLINENNNKYNPSINFDSKYLNIAILSDDITDEKVKANHEFKLMIYNNKEYHIYNLICTDLPILNISYIKKNKKNNIPIEIYLFDNLKNNSHRVTISGGRLKITDSGDYKLTLFLKSPGRNERENPLSIFNMEPRSEYILSPTNTNIDLSEEINEEDIKENYLVELFINNEYVGLYSLK